MIQNSFMSDTTLKPSPAEEARAIGCWELQARVLGQVR